MLERREVAQLLRQLQLRAIAENNYPEVEVCAVLHRNIYRQAKNQGYGRGSLECRLEPDDGTGGSEGVG